MASPLHIFRHNKKILMAAVLVMSMISFVFIGSTGMFERGTPDPVLASTKYGYIKMSDMGAFRARSAAANHFITELVPLTLQAMQREGRLPAENLQMLAGLTLQQFERGGLIVPLEDNEQAMSEMLWEKKAEDLGIEIDDQAVNEFIQRLTEELVPVEDIKGAMDRMRISERSLFYALSQRLKAVRARELLAQNVAMATPATRLDWFRRTRSKATIEFLPVRVESFVDQVTAPTDSELQKLFNDHRLDIAQPNSARPGFYQVRRSAFAYFTARIDDFLKPEEVTDAEIAAYYEQNKSLFPYQAPPASESESTTPPAESSTPPAETGAAPATDGAAGPAEPKPEGTTPPPADETKPTPPPAGDDANSQTAPEPKTSVEGSAQDAPAAEPAAQEPAAPEAAKPADEKPAEEKPAGGATPPATEAAQPGEGPSPDMFAPPTERPKYKPLEEVSQEIRELLAREKARERIDAQLKQLSSRVRFYFSERAAAVTNQTPEPKPLDFNALAAEFGMTFNQTDLMTAQQLFDTNPLGKAMVEGQGIVARYAFETMAINQPMRADGDKLQFAFWKTEDKPAFEPKFAEVRDQVLQTWKLIEARKLAQARAEEQAETARKDGRPLAEVFAQADPKPGVAGPFGWLMRQPFSELTTSLPQWMTSPVPGVEQPGSEFMRGVFGLSVGETGIAWNAPESTVYVVRVTELTPEDLILWQEFAAMPPANYDEVAIDDIMQVRRRIDDNLRQDADLVWQEVENPRQEIPSGAPMNNPTGLPGF